MRLEMRRFCVANPEFSMMEFHVGLVYYSVNKMLYYNIARYDPDIFEQTHAVVQNTYMKFHH